VNHASPARRPGSRACIWKARLSPETPNKKFPLKLVFLGLSSHHQSKLGHASGEPRAGWLTPNANINDRNAASRSDSSVEWPGFQNAVLETGLGRLPPPGYAHAQCASMHTLTTILACSPALRHALMYDECPDTNVNASQDPPLYRNLRRPVPR